MSSRANYVLVDDGGFTLSSYPNGSSIDQLLFMGPAHAINHVQQRARAVDFLFDEDWCEGGALIDQRSRELLFFGGEDLRHDRLRLRLTLALVRRTWAGWNVRWAFEGLGDFVDYLGLDRDLVRSGRERHLAEPERFAEDQEHFIRGVYSVCHRDGRTTLHRSSCGAPSLLNNFPVGVVDRLAALPGHRSLAVPAGTMESGAHLDLAERRIDLWQTGWDLDLQARVWSGWRLVHHGAEFEEQVALAGDGLTFIPASQRTSLHETMRDLMGWSSTFDPRELDAALDDRSASSELPINPQFADSPASDLPDEERARIFRWAAAGLPLLPGFTA